MSRSRNIKPGFFQNDTLAECDPLARILFAGLWCEADREGRLEDRPKKIKAACLPYDDCSISDLLNQLASGGFIRRYSVDGKAYIQVVEFKRHQNPHKKEAVSIIPPETNISTVQAQCKPGASTEQAEGKPERARLIPDSQFLIPDSLQEQSAPSGEESPNGDPLGGNESVGAGEQEPPAIPVDPIWGTGLAFLTRKGIPEKAARSLIGKLRKAAGDVRTGAILAQAEAEDVIDPAPWLMAAAARAGPNAAPPVSKTEQFFETQARKIHDMVARRNRDGTDGAVLPQLGQYTAQRPAGKHDPDGGGHLGLGFDAGSRLGAG